MGKLRFFATTVIGLEDVASKEVENLIGVKAEQDVGRIAFKGSLEDVYLLNLKSSTINKVFIELCRSAFESLDDIYRLAKSLDYTWILDEQQTFAIRSERIGVHNFTSMDVSRVAGQAVIDSFANATGKRLKVNLDEPDVEIYCLVRNNDFIMGVNTTGASLHKRGYRVYSHPAALKPTIASAMLRIGGWTPDKSLIDPMCGGATIPIEAALEAKGVPPNHLQRDFAFLKLKICNQETFEKIKAETLAQQKEEAPCTIYAMEKFAKHLQGGIENARKAGVHEAINFKIGDATKPQDYPKAELDFIVVNPPYGLRANPREGVRKLYENFLKTLKTKFPGATLVLITAASNRFREAAESAELAVMNERKIWHGELLTSIFKCKV
ncbi:MAG: tRNA (guanine(6)-N2)-methyltransferase [Candidatus Bathyarchaeia archaeon]